MTPSARYRKEHGLAPSGGAQYSGRTTPKTNPHPLTWVGKLLLFAAWTCFCIEVGAQLVRAGW